MLHRFFVISFFVLISVPMLLIRVDTIAGDQEINENRKKAALPEFSIKDPFAVITETENYVKDNLAFRSSLTRLYIKIKAKLFDAPPLPEEVVKGKEGWLFLGNKLESVFNESLGLIQHSPVEIENICESIISMKSFCDSLGIGFYMAVAPYKHSIYPEYLPLKPTRNPKRLDLVKTQLKDKWNFDLIDLRQVLLSSKDSCTLYYKSDTHWNEYGSFYATQMLLDVIRRDFPVAELKMEDYEIKTIPIAHADLAKILNLDSEEKACKFVNKVISRDYKIVKSFYENPRKASFLKTRNSTARCKSIIFRDSFFDQMTDFYAHSVGQNTFIWSYKLDKEAIIKENPDFVVFVVAERNLNELSSGE